MPGRHVRPFGFYRNLIPALDQILIQNRLPPLTSTVFIAGAIDETCVGDLLDSEVLTVVATEKGPHEWQSREGRRRNHDAGKKLSGPNSNYSRARYIDVETLR